MINMNNISNLEPEQDRGSIDEIENMIDTVLSVDEVDRGEV